MYLTCLYTLTQGDSLLLKNITLINVEIKYKISSFWDVVLYLNQKCHRNPFNIPNMPHVIHWYIYTCTFIESKNKILILKTLIKAWV